ncbi:MAG: S41 family peptidase, partial [Coriobacteriia bacterium]|nr:S41 family peptidase [Coriobacteriia bacterium]
MANPSSRRQRPVLLAVIFSVIFVLLLAASFVLGNLSSWSGTLDVARLVGLPDLQAERSTGTVGQTANSDEPGSLDQFTARLNEVAAILNSDALHVFTQSELDTATKTAIDGLLAVSSDKYAQYFTPSEYADYESSANSQFVGIGIQVQSDSNGVPMVVRVFPNSPAAEQGVESGDLIIAIDGVRQDWTVEDAVNTIKRDPGQSVTIIWQRSGEERTTTMAVRQVTIPTVTTQLLEYQGHQVGYIYLSQFSPNSAAEMRTAINDLTSQGAESFILDLRDNPGGLLDQAVAITSLFVAQGDVVQIVENSGTTVKKVTGQPLTDKSLVVLINGASASAAELTTAALQENGRATVIGEQSYGKGTVQAIQPLSFGGAIKYTIAHYLGPDGTS